MAEHDERGAVGSERTSERQRIVRVPGSRRAQLTPAPGTDPSPDVEDAPDRSVRPARKGPNDDRLFGDVPPHY